MVSPRFRIGRASGLAPYEDKIAVGVWHYTTTLDDLSAVTPNGSPVQHRGSSGFYGIGDWTLVSADSGYGQLSAFLQAGLGDNRVDRFGSYVGVGLAAKGFLTGRPDDETGLAVAMARNASHYLLQQQVLGVPVRRAETAIELTYLAQATSWLAVQPDLQYVIHPNTDSRQRNALVIQLEGELSF
jgi:porin